MAKDRGRKLRVVGGFQGTENLIWTGPPLSGESRRDTEHRALLEAIRDWGGDDPVSWAVYANWMAEQRWPDWLRWVEARVRSGIGSFLARSGECPLLVFPQGANFRTAFPLGAGVKCNSGLFLFGPLIGEEKGPAVFRPEPLDLDWTAIEGVNRP